MILLPAYQGFQKGVPGASSNPGTADLLAWWELNEASGLANDSHSNNLSLSDINTVGAGTGVVNGARDYERGASEHHRRNSETLLQLGDTAWTAGLWARLESKPAAVMTLMGKWNYTTNREWGIVYANGSDRLELWVSGNGSSTQNKAVANALGSPATATWYFIVAWHDPIGDTIYIQVNDGTVDSIAHSAGIYQGGGQFALGAWFNSGTPIDFYDGLLDEAFIFNKILSAQERTWLYNGGSGRGYAEL